MSTENAQNPLTATWTGPYEFPPFAHIEPAHFKPAFDAALAEHNAEIDAIAGSAEPRPSITPPPTRASFSLM